VKKNHFRNRYILFADAIFVIASVLASYALRLELGAAFRFYLPSAYWMIGTALVIKPLVYYFFGLYRRLWAYASMQELKLILSATLTASVLVSIVMISIFALGAFTGFPRSTLIIDWLLSIFFVGGLRFMVRMIAENRGSFARNGNGLDVRKTLIVGAGDAGALVVRELQKNPQLNIRPIGFLDDNPSKQKQQIYGVPVIGKITDISSVMDNHKIDEVIIAIPSAPGRVVRLVADVCRLKNVAFKTMPGIYELLDGKVNVSRLREVDITDLLRREPASINEAEVSETIRGKKVMITGAGGSIGKELCRQVSRWDPKVLYLMGHGENSIFESILELKASFPQIPLVPVIADMRDRHRLDNVFQEHRPDIVFHAAAHKHVPLMEVNVEDAVTNNIYGTRNIVEASLKNDVDHLIMISSDKAIRPINVMGATKRMAEMIVIDAAHRSGKKYSVVRFGNVLGSRGSVVPLFKSQIATGGPVTVTHPDMMRYFMTIPEAVHLVLQAATFGDGGDTFVLNMGKQVRILDLAEDLIRLSGLEPYKDIEIVFTGIRQGEKLKEDLWEDGHLFIPTSHPEIYRHEGEELLNGDALRAVTDELLKLARKNETQAIVDLLDHSIPGSAVKLQFVTPPEITAIE